MVRGKNVTGFTNSEEAAVGLTEVVPFLLQDKLTELGANFTQAFDFQPYVVRDGLLITGQNPSVERAGGEGAARGAAGCEAGYCRGSSSIEPWVCKVFQFSRSFGQRKLELRFQTMPRMVLEIVMVGERGFEPPAPASRRQCSTRLSYSPTGLPDATRPVQGERPPSGRFRDAQGRRSAPENF